MMNVGWKFRVRLKEMKETVQVILNRLLIELITFCLSQEFQSTISKFTKALNDIPASLFFPYWIEFPILYKSTVSACFSFSYISKTSKLLLKCSEERWESVKKKRKNFLWVFSERVRKLNFCFVSHNKRRSRIKLIFVYLKSEQWDGKIHSS